MKKSPPPAPAFYPPFLERPLHHPSFRAVAAEETDCRPFSFREGFIVLASRTEEISDIEFLLSASGLAACATAASGRARRST